MVSRCSPKTAARPPLPCNRPPGGLSVGSLSAKLIVCLFPALEVAAQMGPTLVVWNVQMLRLVPHTGFILSSRDHRKQTDEILLPEQTRAREGLWASETKNIYLGVSLTQKCSGRQIRVHSAPPQKSFLTCMHSSSGIHISA